MREVWIDPAFQPVHPVMEPAVFPIEKAEFGFPKVVRDWWMRVTGGKCQVEVYTEKSGFKDCPNRAEHVHHVVPESWQLAHGMEPNNSVGLPACKNHHTGGNGDAFTGNFSFHPDMGQAYRDYRAGDKEAFQKAAHKHHLASARGEVFWNSDADGYYLDKMTQKAVEYQIAHPEDPKPRVKPHPDAKRRP